MPAGESERSDTVTNAMASTIEGTSPCSIGTKRVKMEELSGNDVFREHVNKRDLPKVQPLTPSKSKYLTDTIQELERLLKEEHNQQVKEIVRFCHWQINHPIRRNLWVTICNYHNNKNEHEEGYYCSKRNELLGELKIPPSLPPFVDPAFACTIS
ncbi:GTPase-activating protein skywalker-like [Tachypleus tridentatus]|uniref:GTPase-activating protein skywalker-like n=1 Tax=Tachypleus tridentatus TaxID=6853 RepID=UPI003FD61ECA